MSEQSEVILVTMGGDGSLGCFLDDLRQDSYIAENIKNIMFVPLPYGTGNEILAFQVSCRQPGAIGYVVINFDGK